MKTLAERLYNLGYRKAYCCTGSPRLPINALQINALLLSILFLITGCQVDNAIKGFIGGPVATPGPTGVALFNPTVSPSSNTTPTIAVSGVSNGSTVKLFTDSNCTTQVGSGTSTGTTVNLTVASPLTDGVYTFYANKNDGGADSKCSAVSANYSVDTVVSTISLSPIYSEDPEGNTAKSFVVNISPVKPYDVTVDYDLNGSTALSGTHYNGISTGSVVIPANQSSATINYNLLENALAGGQKFLQINLFHTNVATALFGLGIQARNFISDNESTVETLTQVATGDYHTCGITTTGTLKCWGLNGAGALGDGTTTQRFSPVTIDSGTSYSAITAGRSHTCGITTTGTLKCWGYNSYGNLGDGTTTQRLSPVIINSGTSYSVISAGGGDHTCGITTAGVLKCWGSNWLGQLGDGTTTDRLSPVTINSGTSYSTIAAGEGHSCGITTTSTLKCWGSNSFGQLGDGTTTQRLSPVTIDSGVNYSSITAGSGHSCGITTTGTLKCWGYNYYGQIGDGTTTQRLSPVIINSGTSYSVISAGGGYHTCGITTVGVLKCWGSNSYGQLGDGTVTDRATPTVIDSSTNYSSVATSSRHTCGVTTAGALKCWGSNSYGQLGDGVSGGTPAVTDIGTNYSVIAGGETHSCGITSTGILKCWGGNDGGQLGDSTTIQRNTPVVIDIGTNYSALAAGFSHTCAVTTVGVLKCWGSNSYGQLGDGTTTARVAPLIIDSGGAYSSISAGDWHTCGITTTGTLKCWGNNLQGQLGDGTTTSSLSPLTIDSGTNYSLIAAGGLHTCGITTTGVLKCWGHNYYGQIGDGTTIQRTSPVIVDAGTNYSLVTVGGNVGSREHTCGITTTGVLKCWGVNLFGQLGDGTTGSRSTPVIIDAGVNYSSIGAGIYNTCGVTTAGTLKCWGRNDRGQLGDGGMTTINSLPVIIDAGTIYSLTAFGGHHGCGVTTVGTLKCWGVNDSYQLGLGLNYLYPWTHPLGF